MKLKGKISDSVLHAKNCAVCDRVFHTTSYNARYCSASCKRQFFKAKQKNQRWYSVDPNIGKTLPMGTITSWEIPEEKLVFSGDLESLYPKLSEYLSPEQFVFKKESILGSGSFHFFHPSPKLFFQKSFVKCELTHFAFLFRIP